MDTSTLTLKFRLDEPPPNTNIGGFVGLLDDVNSVLVLASLLTIDQTSLPEPYREPPSDSELIGIDHWSEDEVLATAQRIARQFFVIRLTYTSPIDLHLAVVVGSGSVAMLALAAWKVADLWSKVSDARSKHSKANLDREVFGLLQDEVAHWRSVRNVQRHVDTEQAASLAVDKLLAQAYKSLNEAKSISVEET